jgi:hypothetical protein
MIIVAREERRGDAVNWVEHAVAVAEGVAFIEVILNRFAG